MGREEKESNREGNIEPNHAETSNKLQNKPQIPNLSAKKGEYRQCFNFSSFEIINKFECRLKYLKKNSYEKPSDEPFSPNANNPQAFSAQDIIHIARETLVQCKAQKADVLFLISSPFEGRSSLPNEVSEDVELVLCLLASAEMFAHRRFLRARRLLLKCTHRSSPIGNPVQRVVYYLAGALTEKIDRETGNFDPPGLQKGIRLPMDPEQAFLTLLPTIIAIQQELPFTSITQFTGIQAILEGVASSRKIHLVDFGVRHGSHWTILMQALAERKDCPLEHITLSAVGTSRKKMDQAGKWLTSFAEGMKLPFSCKSIESQMKDLNKDLFGLESDEAVAVFVDLRLWSLLVRPDELEKMILAIKDLRPSVMVVIEFEANTNTCSFIDRFHETLKISSTYFDCLATCMIGNYLQYRKIAETVLMKELFRNIIIAEGDERKHRCEKIGFWRELFAKFGIEQKPLSELSLYQAELLKTRSSAWSSCTLDMDGECLILGWKGTSVESVSAWRFSED